MRSLAALSGALALAVQAGGCAGPIGHGSGRYGYDAPYGYAPGWGYRERDVYAGRPYAYGRSDRPDRPRWERGRWDRDRSRERPPPPPPPAAAFRPPPPDAQAGFNPPVWHQGRWIGPTPRDTTPPTE
jgi:hypothetical protein